MFEQCSRVSICNVGCFALTTLACLLGWMDGHEFLLFALKSFSPCQIIPMKVAKFRESVSAEF